MVLLEKVQELPQYERINVRVKVMHMKDVTELCSSEKVQEVVIADATGQVKLGVVGEHLGTVKEGCSIGLW